MVVNLKKICIGWWIIGGYPNKVEREKLAIDTGARLVYLNTDRDTCINRLSSCSDYRAEHREEWISYIDKWFEKFVE